MSTTEKYKRLDPAGYLDDLEDVVGYLAIVLEESGEDPTAVPRAFGVIARSQNMSELARRVGMSRDGLYKALSAEGDDLVDDPQGHQTRLGCVSSFTRRRRERGV
jgi:probable addiction module antidote protein